MTHFVAEDVGSMTATGDDDAVIVALEGDLDIASAPAVREQLLGTLRPGACRLVIDMSGVGYADASGLDVLVSTRRRAVLLGGTVQLAALRPEVARVLMITGLSRRLGTYPTVRAAVADRRPGTRTAPPGIGPGITLERVLRAQPRAGLDPDRGELHAAVAAILASADAWRDADPRRRFSAGSRSPTRPPSPRRPAVFAGSSPPGRGCPWASPPRKRQVTR